MNFALDFWPFRSAEKQVTKIIDRAIVSGDAAKIIQASHNILGTLPALSSLSLLYVKVGDALAALPDHCEDAAQAFRFAIYFAKTDNERQSAYKSAADAAEAFFPPNERVEINSNMVGDDRVPLELCQTVLCRLMHDARDAVLDVRDRRKAYLSVAHSVVALPEQKDTSIEQLFKLARNMDEGDDRNHIYWTALLQASSINLILRARAELSIRGKKFLEPPGSDDDKIRAGLSCALYKLSRS